MRFGSTRLTATAAAVLAAVAWSSMAWPAVLGHLNGRWAGWGSITLANGSSEQVKCIATYLPSGSNGLQQNLRCASQSYKIDAVAKLLFDNDLVSGDWEEKTYAAAGSIRGRVNGTGFNLSIQGAAFSAAMAVTTQDCKQTISITPQGFDISRISIGLSKC